MICERVKKEIEFKTHKNPLTAISHLLFLGFFNIKNMAERKSLSKKVRFEVFKRDNFTCQYCGKKAPDVILEVDHINPVSKGGKNEILNLLTSCFDCNRGKSKNKINDNSIVEKQRLQIEELNIRRQQLEMMLEWRDGIVSLNEQESKNAINHFNSLFKSFSLSEHGEGIIKKLVKKHGLVCVLDNIDKSYFKYGKDDTLESVQLTINKIEMFINISKQPEYLSKISYIKGIIRNKFYINEKIANESLLEYYNNGYSLDELKSLLIKNTFRNWTEFINYVNE